MQDRKTLVVFHSRGGATRRLAQTLAATLKADREEIVAVQPHEGAIGYAQCLLESMAALTPAIVACKRDPARYGLVVVGTPVWGWGPSSPVRTWIAQHHEALADTRVAFFCTMGGSGAALVFARMGELTGHEPVATLALTSSQVRGGAKRAIDGFVQVLKTSGKTAAAPRKVQRTRTAAHAA